jgi:hypothetical protein
MKTACLVALVRRSTVTTKWFRYNFAFFFFFLKKKKNGSDGGVTRVNGLLEPQVSNVSIFKSQDK